MGSNGWRPKHIRNNNFTTWYDRQRLANEGILIGSAHTKYAPAPTPQPTTPTNEPKGGRFAQNTQPPTPEQLKAHMMAQQPKERFGGGYTEGVPNERLGFRDEWISKRHRMWGKDAPMVDIDFLVADYNKCEVVALVEYKLAIRDDGVPTAPPDFTRANYRTLINMANGLSVPFLTVYYNRNTVTFTVYPANGWAMKMLNTQKPILLTETEWVTRIYALSNREVPEPLLSRLSKTK